MHCGMQPLSGYCWGSKFHMCRAQQGNLYKRDLGPT